MYNQDIFKKLEEEFGSEKMLNITDILSVFYDIKYNAAKDLSTKEEFDYERTWWKEKHIEIISKIEVI